MVGMKVLCPERTHFRTLALLRIRVFVSPLFEVRAPRLGFEHGFGYMVGAGLGHLSACVGLCQDVSAG